MEPRNHKRRTHRHSKEPEQGHNMELAHMVVGSSACGSQTVASGSNRVVAGSMAEDSKQAPVHSKPVREHNKQGLEHSRSEREHSRLSEVDNRLLSGRTDQLRLIQAQPERRHPRQRAEQTNVTFSISSRKSGNLGQSG